MNGCNLSLQEHVLLCYVLVVSIHQIVTSRVQAVPYENIGGEDFSAILIFLMKLLDRVCIYLKKHNAHLW